MSQLKQRLAQARAKYPSSEFVQVAILEELGEFMQAMLVYERDRTEANRLRVDDELLDVITVITRNCTEVLKVNGRCLPEDMVGETAVAVWRGLDSAQFDPQEIAISVSMGLDDPEFAVTSLVRMLHTARVGASGFTWQPAFTGADFNTDEPDSEGPIPE